MNKYAWRDVIGDTQNVNDNKQRNKTVLNTRNRVGVDRETCKGQQTKKHKNIEQKRWSYSSDYKASLKKAYAHPF